MMTSFVNNPYEYVSTHFNFIFFAYFWVVDDAVKTFLESVSSSWFLNIESWRYVNTFQFYFCIFLGSWWRSKDYLQCKQFAFLNRNLGDHGRSHHIIGAGNEKFQQQNLQVCDCLLDSLKLLLKQFLCRCALNHASWNLCRIKIETHACTVKYFASTG